jgi:hypothetical protein
MACRCEALYDDILVKWELVLELLEEWLSKLPRKVGWAGRRKSKGWVRERDLLDILAIILKSGVLDHE